MLDTMNTPNNPSHGDEPAVQVLRERLDEADAAVETAAEQYHEAQERLDRSLRLAESLRSALALLAPGEEEAATDAAPAERPRHLWFALRAGGPEHVAVRLAAARPDHRLEVTALAQSLQQFGDYASRQSAYATAYTTLDRSARFTKAGRGLFELVAGAEPLGGPLRSRRAAWRAMWHARG